MTAPPEHSSARRESPTGEQFGRVVRQIRVEREMSLQTLGKAAGLHWTYLSGIERGRRNPSLRVLAAIAGSFELSTAELIRQAEQLRP
ncbi:MAG TPA: helix-turn-helix transcriptional regulator [Solirubrobacterales bacterium]|nr:helix-turn-helix transcriptional regulator [Solirubrobacterales bacterium]